MLIPKNIFVLTDIELVPDGDGEVVRPGLLGPVRQLYEVVEPGAGHLPDQLLAAPPRPRPRQPGVELQQRHVLAPVEAEVLDKVEQVRSPVLYWLPHNLAGGYWLREIEMVT